MNLLHNTMTTVNTGLMLSMLAIAGLFAGGFLTMAPMRLMHKTLRTKLKLQTRTTTRSSKKTNLR